MNLETYTLLLFWVILPSVIAFYCYKIYRPKRRNNEQRRQIQRDVHKALIDARESLIELRATSKLHPRVSSLMDLDVQIDELEYMIERMRMNYISKYYQQVP